ncbi:hypothetical protein Cgig2_003423 [Carnegiea gigantea]|uniref:Reverse transcriptase zinc-binding domain-containing protein n=1 Tax=Carnegiea gigantea TaxID=171969 RepID=A0A9Q1KA85_9CARY|nr:hypothetical protein Cgig2_003423 [Carnegiea gigantea]
MDAETILNIPLCTSWPRDKLTWHFFSTGELSMKTAYHLIMQVYNDDVPECSSPLPTSFWKSLWLMDIPPRMKMFAWRACSNALPANAALASMVHSVDARCGLCGHLQESAVYAPLECDYAAQRVGNRVAHTLVHLQPYSCLLRKWLGDGPYPILDLALKDLCTASNST